MNQDSDAPDLRGSQYADSPTDHLPARLVHGWSADKHYYLGRFIEIFSKGMHRKWPSRAYIDLFSGPGVCMFRDFGTITDGSPLLALKAAPPFARYFFSDLDPVATEALKIRCRPFESRANIEVYQKDCNEAASEIASKIDSNTLCLAFLDPTNLALKFSSIETLTRGKRMDLIIHFPHGTAINRNIEKFFLKEKSEMDDFFGGNEWRGIYEKDPENLTAGLLSLYSTKLKAIGYNMEPDQAVLIKNSKNVPLYALLFATKDPTGGDFWRKIKKIEASGQRGLPGMD